MEKIVVVYKTPADWGCEFETVACFLYQSATDWLLDFESTLLSLVKRKKQNWDSISHEFIFTGHLFDSCTFCNMKTMEYTLPLVYTLDEWFEKNLQ
jgi:hypothetical protein